MGVVLAALALCTVMPSCDRLVDEPMQATEQCFAYPNLFFNPKNFSYQLDHSEVKSEQSVVGAVVPHHLLAHKLIEGVFLQLHRQKPSTVILVGPNHRNRGEKILTTPLDWQTPFGIVQCDQSLIAELTATQTVKINQEVFKGEHSIGNLMPFLSFYLPDAKVVPIILHYDLSQQEAMALGTNLASLLDDNQAILLASVDFSHYLRMDEAQLRDKETIRALKAKDLSKIFALDNEYLDSPAAIGVLLSAMTELGLDDFNILENTNSGTILGNDLIEATSYITLTFQVN